MQFCKPMVFLAALGLCVLPSQILAAQQNPSSATNSTTGNTNSQTPAGKTPGTSQTTVTVPPPDVPKRVGTAAASKNTPDTKPDEKSADKKPIRISVNEVIVPVTVTDDKGRFVSDLDQKDFHIFEENKPQTIRFFTRERSQPVVIGFLLDLSAESRIHWKNFQNATEELIQNLLTGDKKYSGYLITYSQDAELAVDTTSAPEPLVEKVRKLKPGGGSALFDAIYLACTSRKLINGEPIQPRRVVVIIGDGHDNASKHSLGQVIELAQRNLVTIYCISTQAFGFTNASDDNLVRLATETGGRVVYPLGDVYKDTDGFLSKPSDDGNYALTVGTGAYKSAVDNKMYRAVADIVGEVTTQYIIRYVSDADSAKAYRNVKVVVDLGNVRVRARKGYYAVTP
ncbi:MAG: VWA domain-containing protein [Bryobacteraceae bacterium]